MEEIDLNFVMFVKSEKLVLVVGGIDGLSRSHGLFIGVGVDEFGAWEMHGEEICQDEVQVFKA